MKLGNKNEDQLKRGESAFEHAARWGGAAIVFGLLVEVWLSITFSPPESTLLQVWGPVFADSLIALGVFFEVLFGMWALQHSAELRRR